MTAMTTRLTKDGRRVSLLGYGAMRLPTVDGLNAAGRVGGKPIPGTSRADIDQKLLDSQVKYMLDQGVSYFDTSPAYCMGRSEAHLGRALKASGYARGAYMLATKLSNFAPHLRLGMEHPVHERLDDSERT